MDAGAAMLELAIDAHDCALAVRYWACGQEPHELGHQLFADRAARLEQLGQVLDVTGGEWIADDRHGDRPNDRARNRLSHVGGDRVAQQERSADVKHANSGMSGKNLAHPNTMRRSRAPRPGYRTVCASASCRLECIAGALATQMAEARGV